MAKEKISFWTHLKQSIAKSLLLSVGLRPKNVELEMQQLVMNNKAIELEMRQLVMNNKAIATHLADAAIDRSSAVDPVQPEPLGMGWRPTTQGDLTSNWCRWWLHELMQPQRMHRKNWEYGWILQELFANGMLQSGRRGLGFGCGNEPLPSYFAKIGVGAVISDLDPSEGKSADWAATGQHASTLSAGFREGLIDRAQYEALVSHRFVDMTAIPDDLRDFDFCWSICSLEHLGSIDAGLAFIENSMKTLRPGGVAVHTTEFNCLSNDETIETGESVIFRRRDFEVLAVRLREAGHDVGVIGFDTGAELFDRCVDLLPYELDSRSAAVRDFYGEMDHGGHLRIRIGGHVSTCYGVVVRAR